MMSGIEVVGLTVASFSIVVNAIHKLPEGLETIRILRGYRRELAGYGLRLETQRTIYHNTLYNLLYRIVPTKALRQLFDADPARVWEQPEYEAGLRARLGHSCGVYLSIVERLREDLEEMKKMVAKDQYGKA